MSQYPLRLRAREPAHRVVGVRSDIRDAPRRRQRGIVPPREGHGSRTRILPAVDNRSDVAQRARIDNLFGSQEQRLTPRPERHEMGQSRLAVRLPHLVRLGYVHAYRLIAKHVLPVLCARHHGFMVQRVGSRHDDEVDIRVIDDLTPVIRDEITAILLCRRLQPLTVSSAQRDDCRVLFCFAYLLSVRRPDKSGGANHPNLKLHTIIPLFLLLCHYV